MTQSEQATNSRALFEAIDIWDYYRIGVSGLPAEHYITQTIYNPSSSRNIYHLPYRYNPDQVKSVQAISGLRVDSISEGLGKNAYRSAVLALEQPLGPGEITQIELVRYLNPAFGDRHGRSFMRNVGASALKNWGCTIAFDSDTMPLGVWWREQVRPRPDAAPSVTSQRRHTLDISEAEWPHGKYVQLTSKEITEQDMSEKPDISMGFVWEWPRGVRPSRYS